MYLQNFSLEILHQMKEQKEFKEELENMGIKVYNVPIPRKITAIKEMISSYKKIKKVCSENNYDILHCHSPIGGVLQDLLLKTLEKKEENLYTLPMDFTF